MVYKQWFNLTTGDFSADPMADMNAGNVLVECYTSPPKPVVQLTADQKRIKELEDKLNALLAAQAAPSTPLKTDPAGGGA